MAMRVVLDNNVVVSAILFGGLPRRIFEYQRAHLCELLTSTALCDELREVFGYAKFGEKLARMQRTPDELVAYFQEFTELVDTSAVKLPSAARDPDDNHVLACAVAGQAMLVVSGDSDLLVLDTYEGIRIITVADFVTLMDAADDAS